MYVYSTYNSATLTNQDFASSIARRLSLADSRNWFYREEFGAPQYS